MTDEPLMIKLEEIEHHENGDATYKFDMNEKGAKDLAELGLKLALYCGVSNVDLQAVFDWILAHIDKPEQETPDTIWVDFDDEGVVIAGGAGPARYHGEHTYVKWDNKNEKR